MISLAQSINCYEYHIKRQQAQQWYSRFQNEQLINYRISRPWPEEEPSGIPTFEDLQQLRSLIESKPVRAVYVMPVKSRPSEPEKVTQKSKGFSL